MTSSWNPASYIRGLIHGIVRGVLNGYGPCEVFALCANLFGVSKAFLPIKIFSQERINYILALTYYGINWHIVTCVLLYISLCFRLTWFAWIWILIIHICCSALVHVYVGVCVWRVHVSACERDIESLVFRRWIENARLCAPIPFFFFFLFY